MKKNITIEKSEINKILGIGKSIPLGLGEMAIELSVTFDPEAILTDRLSDFVRKMSDTLAELGAEVADYNNSLNSNGKVRARTTIFTSGFSGENLVVKKVETLHNNPIVGLFDMPCPIKINSSNQEILDSIVGILAADVFHIAIFVEPTSWTLCSMNGAFVKYGYDEDFKKGVAEGLIPKLTAQVIPPELMRDIEFEDDSFDSSESKYSSIIEDFRKTSDLLRDNELIMSHTSVDTIPYKNKFHERIVKSYLDQRSGMSYGFLVRQIPTVVEPAIASNELEPDTNQTAVRIGGQRFIVNIPDIWLISTRSGCNKSALDTSTDLVLMGLVDGKLVIKLPKGDNAAKSTKPSYDTLTIFAHAVGNALISSVLLTINGKNQFSDALNDNGLSLFHWHGYPTQDQLGDSYVFHGQDNPSVSCSTFQSAIYALNGKLDALSAGIEENIIFEGDVHIEPHHGTNISSTSSLSEITKLVEELIGQKQLATN